MEEIFMAIKNIALLKNAKVEIYCLCSMMILSFILYGNLLFAIFGSLVSLVLSYILLLKKEEIRQTFHKKESSYSFFYSFLKGIEESLPIKSAYESACRYLVSYQKMIPYDEMDDNHTLNLYDYQKYFDFILKKDKENEARLLLYRPLMEDIKDRLLRMKKRSDLIKKRFLSLFVIILSFLLLMVVFILIGNNKEVFKDTFYKMGATLLLSLLSPFILLMEYQSYRGILNA